MSRKKRIHVETPRTDGGSVFGFIAVVILFHGALAMQAGTSETKVARTVFLERQLNVDSQGGEQAQDTEDMQSPATDILVGSTEPDAAPLCDIAACSDAYRSFRASDCTFQPYEGERRLCTR